MEKNKKQNLKFNIFAIFLIIILSFALTPVTFQNDTFYTIKIGELIWQNGIDMQDHFSWHENLPYTYPHWGYDLIMYGIYNCFGFTGIYVSTVILASILGICIFFSNSKISKNKIVSLVVSLFSMYLLKDYITARAQLVTFILFVLTILCIEQFIETNKKRYLLFLLIIPTLIANLHVAVWPFYFILFIPYIVEYLLFHITKIDWIDLIKITYRKIQKQCVKPEKKEEIKNKITLLNKKKEEKENKIKERRENPYKLKISNNKCIKWLILVVIIAAFTGLCTPLKDVPYTYLVKTMQGNTVQNINEHLPLTLIENKNILVVFSIFLAILILADSKIKLSDFFMLGGLGLLCFISRRQTSMFVLIAGTIFSKLIVNLIERYNPKAYILLKKIINSIYGKIVCILLILVCGILLLKPKMNDKFIDETSYPVQASNFIIENLELDKLKLYNEYNYGSYLLFRGIPVFIDSRADLYAPEFNGTKNKEGDYLGRDIFSDFLNISSIATFYEDKFEDYGITHILTGKYSKLNMLLAIDDNYELLYKDNDFVLYKRKNAGF